MGFPEELQEGVVGGLGGVVDDADRFGVAGEAAAHLFVGGVRSVASLVADQGRPDALGLPELALGAPEAAQAEVGDAQVLGVRAEQRGAEDRVAVGDGEGRLGAAFSASSGEGRAVLKRLKSMASGSNGRRTETVRGRAADGFNAGRARKHSGAGVVAFGLGA